MTEAPAPAKAKKPRKPRQPKGRAGADPNEYSPRKATAALETLALTGGECPLAGAVYPEDSTILYGGRHWTCTGGRWV